MWPTTARSSQRGKPFVSDPGTTVTRMGNADGADGAPRVCVFGATPDTGNLGVSALMEATLSGIVRRLGRPEITVFDNGWGERPGRLLVDGEPFDFRLRGARIGRRYWRSENLWNMRVSGALGGLGNPGVRQVDGTDAVLDISGGDSFTDLYGRSRRQLVMLPKLLALQRGVPLVLLPQTYGPFASPRCRRLAERIVRGATMAWARDLDSYSTLRALLGNAFDSDRHRCGVDVAFLLEPRRPPERVTAPFEEWLVADGSSPVAGLGISGLVYGDPAAAERFGLAIDYREVVRELAHDLVTRESARLVLVPHVRGSGSESDDRACQDLLERLGPRVRERVIILPGGLNAGETKWCIGRLGWFCGTRMHSTIAALSSGVPAAAIAYSGKTRGVFATCGQEEWVVDARMVSGEELAERVLRSWHARVHVAEALSGRLPAVRMDAEAQLDAIAAVCSDFGRRPEDRRSTPEPDVTPGDT